MVGYLSLRCTVSIARAAFMLSFLGAAACSAGPAQRPNDDAMRRSAHQVEALEAELPKLLGQLADQRANRRGIRAILEMAPAQFEASQLQHLETLRTLYKAHDYQLRWVDYQDVHAALNASGRQLFKGLEAGVSRHGIWPDEFHLRALKSIELPNTQASQSAPFEQIRLHEDERAALNQWLRANSAPEGVEAENRAALLVELIAEGAPLARLNAPIEAQAARLSAAARLSSRMDILLSDALIQYALRMRFANPAWQKGVTWPLALREVEQTPDSAEPSMSKVEGEALAQARRDFLVMQAMEPVFADPTRVADALERLVPPFEPYRRLAQAFEKYTEYVGSGGWPELPSSAHGLRRGDSDPWVSTLKERLRIEGYYQGDASEEFGQDLRQAVMTYQKTHQFLISGRLSAGLIRSLNVSALQRRHQIQLSLQRWRESRIGADPHFVLVNLPDFHASVWQDGERKMYFGVVVGANRRAKKGNFPRETPRFSDEIGYIVFNPYWNVTKNIRELEVEPKQAKDPTYFEREGFEYFTSANGHRVLRQKPGPGNALGQVKFLFPNKYNIYLHDTPDKLLFEKPHRAFSHGCVRIENPMDFAHYLLDLDGRWMGEKREKALEKWFEKDGETWVNLTQNLPIHIEYYVVRVDDEGRTHFLSDLYALDEPRLEYIAQKYERDDASNAEVDAQAQQMEAVE